MSLLLLLACGGGEALDAESAPDSMDASMAEDAVGDERDGGSTREDGTSRDHDASEAQPDALIAEEDVEELEADTPEAQPDVEEPEPDVAEPEPEPEPSVPFNEAHFKATHNSYSGEERRSLRAQLDAGVRFFELDLHDNDFASFRDYRVGHDSPGDETLFGQGNPQVTELSAWLEVLDAWSDQHSNHAPITLCLDIKDNLMDNHSFALGNLGALNALLSDVYGDKLVLPREIDDVAWPSVDSLRGRFIAVLSGDQGTRMGYRWDVGANPAVAMNEAGQIIEVHDSGVGTLWYWTGQMGLNGRVTWHRHGRYDTGADPAVAINNDGWIVEVHKSERGDALWSTAGRMGEDYEVQWADSQRYDSGVLPTVRFESLDGMSVREIHKSQNNDQNWQWSGVIGTNMTLSWSGNIRTSDRRFDEAEQAVGRRLVAVRTGTDSITPSNALLFDTHISSGERIRYTQVAFVEFQRGGDGRLDRDGLWFYTARASARDWSAQQRARGKIVRQWGFNSRSDGAALPANFPATDHPFDAWYADYASSIGAVE